MNEITDYRRELGLTQLQLAAKLDIRPSEIARWETDINNISLSGFISLCGLFAIKPFELLPPSYNCQKNIPIFYYRENFFDCNIFKTFCGYTDFSLSRYSNLPLIAFSVQDESLSPRILHGDTVIVLADGKPFSDGVGVLVTQIGSVKIGVISDYPHCTPIGKIVQVRCKF